MKYQQAQTNPVVILADIFTSRGFDVDSESFELAAKELDKEKAE